MRLSDYRRIARERLSGKWLMTVLVTFVAGLLGGTLSTGASFSCNVSYNTGTSAPTGPDSSIMENEEALTFLLIFIAAVMIISILAMLIAAAISIFFCSVVCTGYCKYLLNVVDFRDSSIKDLFSQFSNYKNVVLTQLRTSLIVWLGMLLFIVPGIIWGYDYAMVHFIMADHPEYSPKECMNASKTMMYGHRWEYFLLDLSFIGWAILCIFTCGIGNYFLIPYKDTAKAVFYRNISGTLVDESIDPIVDTSPAAE